MPLSSGWYGAGGGAPGPIGARFVPELTRFMLSEPARLTIRSGAGAENCSWLSRSFCCCR